MSDILERIRLAQMEAMKLAAMRGTDIRMASIVAGERVVLEDLERKEREFLARKEAEFIPSKKDVEGSDTVVDLASWRTRKKK